MYGGPITVHGLTYRGLGLNLATRAYKRRGKVIPARWVLTHLGSGHRLLGLRGAAEEVKAVASEIAELGDWTFDGLEGWRNQFPDAKERLREVVERHKGVAAFGGYSGTRPDVARQIAMNRT